MGRMAGGYRGTGDNRDNLHYFPAVYNGQGKNFLLSYSGFIRRGIVARGKEDKLLDHVVMKLSCGSFPEIWGMVEKCFIL